MGDSTSKFACALKSYVGVENYQFFSFLFFFSCIHLGKKDCILIIEISSEEEGKRTKEGKRKIITKDLIAQNWWKILEHNRNVVNTSNESLHDTRSIFPPFLFFTFYFTSFFYYFFYYYFFFLFHRNATIHKRSSSSNKRI